MLSIFASTNQSTLSQLLFEPAVIMMSKLLQILYSQYNSAVQLLIFSLNDSKAMHISVTTTLQIPKQCRKISLFPRFVNQQMASQYFDLNEN